MTDVTVTTAEQRMREQCRAAQEEYAEVTAPARDLHNTLIANAERTYVEALNAASRARHEMIAEAQSAFSDALRGPRAVLAEAIEAAEQEYYDATPHLPHPLRRTQ